MHDNISEVNGECRVLEGILIFIAALQIFLPKTWQSKKKKKPDYKIEHFPVPSLITKQIIRWLAPWCNKVRKLNHCVEKSTLPHNYIGAVKGWYLEVTLLPSFVSMTINADLVALKIWDLKILWFFYPFSTVFTGIFCGCAGSAE